uniref:Uncharacterized protein LOC113790592 n=1 Tax=Dermatophagoides pteronyssinus TaxID=6956 RepID=A0A6P6XTC2_DERPT|nr:uncharacterized protein LOC113790592 [Dermatophagoides pteronyssinus]
MMKKLFIFLSIFYDNLYSIISNLFSGFILNDFINASRMIWPLLMNHPLAYFEHYFICYRIVGIREQNQKQFQQIVRDPLRMMYIIMGFFALRLIYFTYSTKYSNDQTWIILNGNIIHQNGLDNYANLFVVLLIIQSIIYLNMLYYNNPNANLLDRVLIRKQKRVFFRPYHYRKYSAVDFVEFTMKTWLHLLYYFIIYVDLCILASFWSAYRFIVQNRNEFFNQGFFGYLRIVQVFLNRISFSLSFIIYAHANAMMATTAMAFMVILTVLCWQTRQFLLHNDKGQLSNHIWHTLSRFQTCHTKNLKRFGLGSIYSRALLIFLAINIPFNCYQLIFLTYRTDNWKIRYFCGSIWFQQVICIFGIHLMFAMCNDSFQKSSKRFISLLAINHRKFHQIDFGRQLKITNYGESFHTKNKYGLTYGNVELVSMMEFVKFSLLYSQALMFIYSRMIDRRSLNGK